MLTGLVGLVDLVADSLSVGVLVADRAGELVWVNRAARQLVAPDDPAALLAAVGAGAPAGMRREVVWPAPDGSSRWFEVRWHRLDGGGDDLRVLQVAEVTDRHDLAVRGSIRDRRLDRVEALARTGSWEWRVASNEVDFSDELLRLVGYPLGTPLDYATYRARVHPDDLLAVEQSLAEALRTGAPFTVLHRVFRADGGGERLFECAGEVVPDGAGRPAHLLVTAHDVTDDRRVRDGLAFLTAHDPLTGLLHRRAITERLRERLAGPATLGALLVLDLDGFRDINALLGPSVGDRVLRAVADLLRGRLDEGGAPGTVTGRLGEDEFAVLLPDGDASDALAIAESLCAAVAQHAFATTDAAASEVGAVTASIGVAPLTPAGDCDVLLANADLALREAKEAGRNTARVYAPEQYQAAARRVSVLARIRDALDRGQLSVFAQPIVDLPSGMVSSHELLVRLNDGLHPTLGPAEFLPAIERTDLVRQLDRWMVEQAVDALVVDQLRRRGLATAERARRPADRRAGRPLNTGLHLHVNVSARSLEDPSFGDYVVTTLRRAGVEPFRLGLEITETAVITNLPAARRLASRLTRAGCRFALDDFGAGFGSFAYLKHLPFTSVKIDGEFVRQADRARGDSVFVQAVVTVARGLNITTVAEYVDREPLVAALTRLGVDRAQGYHFGRPRPLGDLLASG